MILKDGVDVQGLKVEALIILVVAESLWKKYGEELVWTAGLDGKHMEGSKHYTGEAVDLRTRYFNVATQRVVTKELRKRLGSQYDVVMHKTHIHAEFDPK